MSDQFSLQRFGWLLRNDVVRNYRSWLVTSGALALVMLLLSLLGVLDGDVGPRLYEGFFIAILFVWGTVATSQAFSDLHGRTTNAGFLLLPASALEKTAARLVLYTVALFVYLLVFMTLLSAVFEGTNMVLFGVRREFFTPLERTAWQMLPHYIVVQGLFFLGAAWFRKVQFVKTVGAAAGILFAVILPVLVVARVLAPAEMMFGGGGPGAGFFDSLEWIGAGAMVGYYVVLPAFCWFVAWLRVTETQVSHGI